LEKEEVSWAELYALASDWPLLRIVVLRTGYRILRQCLPLLQSTEHVYLDISYLADNEALEVICAAVGPGRLVFGTGTPRVDGAGAVARLAYAGLGEREKELIAAGNLEALLAGAMLD
jgi:predicted TIM-barrel fold metal-dependent hydrolase